VYAYAKALHIIFVVTWFSGLFYIVRLFVYHYEAVEKHKDESLQLLTSQYALMERRLWYGITWPSAIGTLTFGIWMIIINPYLLNNPWMQLKLVFVLGLFIYHFLCGNILNQLKQNVYKHSSNKMRLWNEVSTLFLVSIVFIVILKSTLDWIWGLLGLIVFAAALMLAIRVYKRVREKNPN
jgi:putative membrane protein